MGNGLIATIAWVLVLIIYCVFRANGIEDPALGNVFVVVTGAWVASLTLAQSKKTAKVEEEQELKLKKLERRVVENERQLEDDRVGDRAEADE